MKNILLTALFLTVFVGGAFAQNNIQYLKPNNKQGLNIFETGKVDSVPFTGTAVKVGGAFALQFQGLSHSNTANEIIVEGKDINRLYALAPGFNLATANLNLDVQLAEGVRMEIVTYLSSRNHPEAWVKGGYLQIDEMPFLNVAAIDKAMEYLTIKVGHMEINYGDQHFRRTDNGNAFFNPFVGNYIMDAFATEIGGEVYFKHKGFLAMAGATNGFINGNIQENKGPDGKSLRHPSILGKLGYDTEVNEDLRLRLTASVYYNPSAGRSTLYQGDRTGSRYYAVMANTLTVPATTGRFSPDFTRNVTAVVINPFVKFHGFELFGNLEQAKGYGAGETTGDRTWTQLGVDALYRIGANENFYIGGRYNTVSGKLRGSNADVSIDRMAGGIGWFLGNNILAKVEYVNQTYNDFPTADIRNGGKFSGVMIEGAIAF